MARRPFFSGNYGSALGSTANAANLIARAGETQGQMFANLGSQIGGMIQQYGLNKEKQKKNEGFIKSQSSMLDMLAEQDPDMAAQYASYKENLNNPDLPLSARVEFGKNLVNNITLSTQLQGQRLMQATQAQTLKERQDTENLRNELLKQKKTFNDLGIELKQLEADEGKELSGAKVQNILAKYGLSGKQIQLEEKLLPKRREAMEAQLDTSIMESQSRQQILPGETSLQIKKQEVGSKELDVKNLVFDIFGIPELAQMKADDLKTLSEINKAKLEHTKAYASYIRNKGYADLISAANKSSPTFKEQFKPIVELQGTILSKTVEVPGENKIVKFSEYLDLHKKDSDRYPMTGLAGGLNAQFQSLDLSLQNLLREQKVKVNVPDEPQANATPTSANLISQDYDYSNLDPSVAGMMAGPSAKPLQITDLATINMLKAGGKFRGKTYEELLAEGAIREQ